MKNPDVRLESTLSEERLQLSLSPTVFLDCPSRDQPLAVNPPLMYGLVAKMMLPRPAFGLKIEHTLPENVRFLEATPKANVVGDHLLWNLGRVDPGREIRLQIVVQPEDGATFRPEDLTCFEATYTQNLHFETPLIRPRLGLKIYPMDTVQAGEPATLVFEVANSGNWLIPEIVAQIQVPTASNGTQTKPITVKIGLLYPTETRVVTAIFPTGHRPESAGKITITGIDCPVVEGTFTFPTS